MQLFRIGLKEFPAFDGEGASTRGGRWNSKGNPAVYCAFNISAARLEILAHSPVGSNHRYFTANSDKELSIEVIKPEQLPAGWDASNYAVSSPIGDEWLVSGRTLLLQVPSVASPIDHCVIINPRHPDFKKLKLSKGKKIA